MKFFQLTSIALLGLIVGCTMPVKEEVIEEEPTQAEIIAEVEQEEIELIPEPIPEPEPPKANPLENNWPAAILDEIENSKAAGETVDPEKLFLLSEEQLDSGRKLSGETIRSIGLEPTIYFSYDSDAIADNSKNILREHAEYINKSTNLKILLEGHTDERGSREYNLSLGQRRAESVKNFLLTLGVDASRIEVQTYGEERPILTGHEEIYWQYNRRVELYYQ